MTYEDEQQEIGHRESAAFAALDPNQLLSAVDKAGYQTRHGGRTGARSEILSPWPMVG